jgi:hypothetical protein
MHHFTALVLGLCAVSVAAAPINPAYAQGGWTDPGTTVHLTTSSDRVGIGTTSASAKLHVVGSTRIDGTLSTNVITSRAGLDLRLRAGGVDALRIEPTVGIPNIIGGYSFNRASDGVHAATIAGGGDAEGGTSPNIVTDDFGTIGGGRGNMAGNNAGPTDDSESATVGGGSFNRAEGHASTIGGGFVNTASGAEATVGGGRSNDASATQSTVGGGTENVAGGLRATVGGGEANVANGSRAAIGGGLGNIATGAFATVPGGRLGQAMHTGSFVWADSTNLTFPSQAINQFRVRSTGGAQFVSAVDPTTGAASAGVALAPGGGAWTNSSDRGLKANVVTVDGADILRRLSTVPITQWNLKAQDAAVKHVGPMAQDFYSAFGLGEDERYLNTGDVDGIALVSIQALYQIVTALERKTADLERLTAGLDELRARLTRYEQAAAR